jgi:hypothetical protein
MRYPWYKKINPCFWFGNSDDPVNTPKHANFHPNKPLWVRKLLWGLRNPLHNFFSFVIGLKDQPGVVSPGSIWSKSGQKWNIVLPFISRRGKKYEWYVGWREGLKFGFAFRKANSTSK